MLKKQTYSESFYDIKNIGIPRLQGIPIFLFSQISIKAPKVYTIASGYTSRNANVFCGAPSLRGPQKV